MSLQLAAQHLASRGRGPDTQLVHMAPGEVAGLHALAKAHGGSLTTNPDTGLPEAGFLSSILPMLAGLALGPAGVGLFSSALTAGLGVGAATGVATGSLKKGLMAGLGAYGGAGLGQGLAASAAATPATAATAITPPAGGLGTIGGTSVSNAASSALNSAGAGGVGTNLAGLETGVGNLGGAPVATSGGLGIQPPAGSGLGFQVNPQVGISGAPLGATTTPIPVSPAELTPQASYALEGTKLTPTTSAPGTFDKIGQGFGNLQTEAGRSAFMGKAGVDGGAGLFKYGAAAAAPIAMQPRELPKPKKYDPIDYDFEYNMAADPNAGYTGAYTGERTYFNPTFTERPKMAAGGGLMDIYPGTDTATANYADGGGVAPVEQNPYYSMSGQSGDAFKYLMGQMPAQSRAPAPAAVYAPVTGGAITPKKPTNLGEAIGAAKFGKGFPTYTFDPNTGVFSAPTYVEGPKDATPALEPVQEYAANGGLMALAQGGQSHLGDYSDGGRLLRGPGDGVSDSIPASIGDKRPARLADGEFVVPARIVSELGNGSTEAGARKLYAMMDRVQKARGKTVGKDRVAVNSRTEKMLPA